ncbi:MAG: ABC transporter substrate-binding protein, partial [Bacilli bacterium]
MKKLIKKITLTSLLLSIFVGCSATATEDNSVAITEPTEEIATVEPSQEPTNEPSIEPINVRTMALKGPTAMGLVEFMNNAPNYTDNNYEFTITAAVDEVTSSIVKGNTDLAAVPANVASVLYNNTDGAVEVLGINTLGVLYIVESGDTISSIEDLRGKTIYAPGKGATPEYALTYLLNENGMEIGTDVFVEWKSEPAECLAVLSSTQNAIAMLPQPFVTTATMKNENIQVRLDLTNEWNLLQEGKENPSSLVTGVIIGRKDFIEENPEVINNYMDYYAKSVDYVNSNVEEAAELVGTYDIVPAQVAAKAIPNCN